MIIDIVYRILNDEEYQTELIKKVGEEADEVPEFGKNKAETLKELADLQTVVDSLRKLNNFTEAEIQDAMLSKEKYRGNFDLRHYVEYVDTAYDSEWTEVFRSQPDKYREEEI